MFMLSYFVDPPVSCSAANADTWPSLVSSGASPLLPARGNRSPSVGSSGSGDKDKRSVYWLTVKDDDDSCHQLLG